MPSFPSEDSGDNEQEETDSDIWQIKSNKNASAALSITCPPPGLAVPYTTNNSIPLEFLKLFFTNCLLIILVLDTNRCYLHYYARKGDDGPAFQDATVEEMYPILALILKTKHD